MLSLNEERQKGSFVVIDRHVVLGAGFQLFPDVIQPGQKPPFTRRGITPVGHVEYDGATQTYRLVNDTGGRWTARLSDGSQRYEAGPGESIPLQTGLLIHFGDGSRLARVTHAG